MNDLILVKNQASLVYEYLKKGNTLTTLTAMNDLGVSRLSNALVQLRKQGVNIQRERMVSSEGKYYFVYWIGKAGVQA